MNGIPHHHRRACAGVRPLLRTLLRALAPAVLLVLAPEVVRADDECGAASNGVATCGPSTGDINGGIRYFVSDADGLRLTIQSPTGGATRRIRSSGVQTGSTRTGFGLAIFGSQGDGAGLHLVVEGGTTFRRLLSGSIGSADGIRVRNGIGGSDRHMTGSVTMNLGAGVQIGEPGRPFYNHGIHAIVEAGASGTTTSNAGISIINAGTVRAREQGIRANGHGFKVTSPVANHLNGRIEITHSGSIEAGTAGIHAVSERNADVAIMLEAGGTITSNDEGIFALTRGAAGPGGAGNVTVTSAGTITAKNRAGILARVDTGTGALGVTVNGGTVTATSGTGIHTISGDDGGLATITVAKDRSVTGGTHGIFAEHTGMAGVTVNVAGTVTSGSDEDDAAIKIRTAGPASVTLTDGFSINGDIVFEGGDKNGKLTLAVAENMRGEVTGKVTRVDNLVKSGAGTARLGGDVSFSGSSAMIEGGLLILRGHVDLGNDGTLTVEDGARLAVEIGGADGDHGQITAGTINLAEDYAGIGEIYVAFADGENAEAGIKLARGITVFLGDVPTNTDAKMFDGTIVARVRDDGSITQGDTEERSTPLSESQILFPPRTGSGNAGSSSEGGATGILAIGGGALSYLLWDLVLSAEETPTDIRSNARGLEYRVRSLDRITPPAINAILPASGVSTSLRAHLGSGVHVDLSGTPNLSVTTDQFAQSGRRYGLGLGWRSGRFSTDIGYSRATLTTRSTFSNVAGLGMLEGTHGQRHDQLRANAQLRIETAGVSLAPSLSLYGGTVSGESYTASSPVWLSEIPSVTQDYSGWKAGMTVTPGSSLEAMGLRWHPELRLTTARLADGGGEDLEIVQKDRTGALQLQSRARAALPRAVHALGGGLTVAGGEDWSVRGGYVAMLADGDLEQAAIAGFHLRF